ncbi:uncharacterized protein LOC129601917 [Paramacrobiotus metropolitanus]|uniref:uncharacterized protein LOC129601917 n=1 Tax=Paramacrobiotus metropolitanus TaxID=2943436 RepID=UPI002445FED1|nr:uncharacterized protein LOC129601917 [Paramacrobiotus metropolitanus]
MDSENSRYLLRTKFILFFVAMMFVFLVVLILFSFLHVSFGQSACAGVCKAPLYVTGQTIDVYRANGLWYEYMVGFDQVAYNIVKNGTVRGTYPGSPVNACTSCAYFATWWINFYQPAVANQTGPNALYNCTAIWHQGNMTTAGKRYAVSLYFDMNSEIVNITTTILFTDYDTVEIVYGCDDYPTNADGTCSAPSFWVFTRVKPPLLTDAQRSYIRDKVDKYLKPLCYSHAEMKFSGFDLNLNNLPPCNIAQGSPGPFPSRFLATMPISNPI